MKYNRMESLRITAVAVFLVLLIIGVTGCATTSATPETETTPTMVATKLITHISTGEDPKFFYVTVAASRPLTYTSVKQVSPPGVIFYFPQTALEAGPIDQRFETSSVTRIRASQLADTVNASRIEIQVAKDVAYTVAREGDGIKIAFLKPLVASAPEPEKAETLPNETGAPKVEAAAKPEGSDEIPKAAEAAPVAPQPIDLETLPAAATLESIYTIQSEKSIKIKLLADGVIRDFKSFTIPTPPRIVFDIAKLQPARPQKKEQLIPVNTEWVKSIRYFPYPDKLRLVVDTQEPFLKSFSAVPEENGLLIQVGSDVLMATSAAPEPTAETTAESPQSEPAAAEALRAQSTETAAPMQLAAAATMPPNAAPMATGNETKPEDSGTAAPRPTEAEPKNPQPGSPALVNRIDFTSDPAGKSTLVIGTTRPVAYDIKKETDKRIQLKLFDTQIPEYRRRPLITTRFQSAVDRILPFEAPALKDTSLFAIELREAVPYVVEQADNLLRIRFEASTVPPKPLDEAKLPDWQKVMTQTTLEAAAPKAAAIQQEPTAETMPESTESALTGEEPLTGTTKIYTGEKIALDFYDTDIKNVFRILREVSRKNFAIDKGVSGKVTLTLEQPVPWDQVLDLILKMNGLGMTFEGDIIRIAKQETLEREQKALQARLAAERKARREEQKEEKELEPLYTEYVSVNYANASSEILPKVRPVITKDRGSISVDDRNNQLIVTDTEAVIEKVREIVKKIDQVTPQVLIEARIVEATNTFTRAIGTQWGIVGQGNDSISNSLGGTLDYDLSATNPPTSTLGTIGINFTRLVGTPFSLVNARISASETEGDLNIISAPKIITLNNKKATIKQGVRYPYNKLVDGETRTEFIDVDLLLEVEPLVTPDHRIAMKLKVSNNELGTIVNNQQSFTTKEAETELLVNDGETVVIGGIRKTTKQSNISGVPVMKDVPVLGWLFKSKGITDNKEELLIFITPQIVQLEQRSS